MPFSSRRCTLTNSTAAAAAAAAAHRGEGVVGGLPLVDVVVGVHHRLVAQLAAQDLDRAVGDHLPARQSSSQMHVVGFKQPVFRLLG